MKLQARHIVSFFLIVVWFTPLLFVFAVNIEEKLVHHRMMEKMEREHLRKIIVPAEQVIWMDDNEISIEGHMFDVKKFSLNNGFYTLQGLFDEEETRLMLQLDESTGKNKEYNKLLSQFFEWIPLPAGNSENQDRLYSDNTTTVTLFLVPSFEGLLKTVLTPPPDSSLKPCQTL